jgi:hypothetical protein
MAVVSGYRSTNTVESTILARDIQAQINEYDKNITPLVVLSEKMGGGPRVTVNPKFEWYEEDREVRRDTTTTTGTGTTVAVSDGTLFNANDIWRVTRTGEGLRVVSVATNDVTVIRGTDVNPDAAVALVSGDELIKVGVAKMEGDTSVTSISGNPSQKYNYTQIFERSVSETGTMMNTDTYTQPGDWEFRKRRMIQEYKIDQESAYLWGPGISLNTAGTHPRRVARGIVDSITTNVVDFAGTLTEGEFFSKFNTAFRYGSGTKFGFAGRTPVDVISGFPRGKLEVIQGDNDTTYGLDVMKFRHAHGTLNLMTHNLFETSSSSYFSQVLILDMAGDGSNGSLVRRVYLQNRDTKIEENVQENDRDGRKDLIRGECSIQLGLEKAHALWDNIEG